MTSTLDLILAALAKPQPSKQPPPPSATVTPKHAPTAATQGTEPASSLASRAPVAGHNGYSMESASSHWEGGAAPSGSLSLSRAKLPPELPLGSPVVGEARAPAGASKGARAVGGVHAPSGGTVATQPAVHPDDGKPLAGSAKPGRKVDWSVIATVKDRRTLPLTGDTNASVAAARRAGSLLAAYAPRTGTIAA